MDPNILSLFSNIPDRAYAREGRCMCEGRLVIEKALQNGVELEALLCSEERRAEYEALCRAYAGGEGKQCERPVPVIGLPHAEIEKLVGFDFHRGALAAARRPQLLAPPLAVSVDTAAADTLRGSALVLWQVSDPDNLGTLIRSASALGAGSVILGPGSADPYSRKALRTSMGCAFSMRLWAVRGAEELAACAASSGASLSAACPVRDESAKPLANIAPGKDATSTSSSSSSDRIPRQSKLRAEQVFTEGAPHVSIAPDAILRPLWLLLGNEGWGLPDEVLGQVRYRIAIPMHNKTDSLNVAAAGAILMYELF